MNSWNPSFNKILVKCGKYVKYVDFLSLSDFSKEALINLIAFKNKMKSFYRSIV